MLGEPFSLLIVVFRKTENCPWGMAYSTCIKFLKRELHVLLGSITQIPPTVSMKPSSYLKVTAIMSLIISMYYECSSTYMYSSPCYLK